MFKIFLALSIMMTVPVMGQSGDVNPAEGKLLKEEVPKALEKKR